MEDYRATLTINSSEQASIKINGKSLKLVRTMKILASVIEIEVSQPKAETIKEVITLK
jgi:hypothetical protein